MSNFYDIFQFIWPALLVFQLVVAIIAVKRLGGTGATLMVVGAGIALFRNAYDLIGRYTGNSPDFSDGIPTEYMLLNALGTIGRIVFLIGMLLVVQMVLKRKEQPLGRTEF